jgi:hypothetical protein
MVMQRGGDQRFLWAQRGGDQRFLWDQRGCVKAVSGRSTGWETIVVVRRAARGCGALVGGLAGIAADVADNARVLGAILGSPYPDTSQVGM